MAVPSTDRDLALANLRVLERRIRRIHTSSKNISTPDDVAKFIRQCCDIDHLRPELDKAVASCLFHYEAQGEKYDLEASDETGDMIDEVVVVYRRLTQPAPAASIASQGQEAKRAFTSTPIHPTESQPRPPGAENPTQVSPTTCYQTAQSTLSNHAPAVKLPKIQLPTFDGSAQDWPAFKSLYVTLIHKNMSLSNIEKFQYLRTCLKGTAYAIIVSFILTDENYILAWNAVLSRYDSSRKMAIQHWEKMNAANINSAGSLRNLLACYTENIAMLDNMDLQMDTLSGVIIFHSLFTKIPRYVREGFERTQPDHTALPSFNALRLYLETECDAMELANSHVESQRSARSRSPPRPSPSSPRRRTEFAAAASRRSFHTKFQKSPPITASCPLCTQLHRLPSCPKYMEKSPAARHDYLTQSKRCSNCTGTHPLEACRSQVNCWICQQRHHTSVHPVNNSPASPTVTAFAHKDIGARSAILPTIQVFIQDTNKKYHAVRALMDCGSQASFISSHLVERLGLATMPSHSRIIGIGESPSQPGLGQVRAAFHPPVDGHPWELDMTILKQITCALPSRPIGVSDAVKFSHLHLADPNWMTPGPIDLLFGADVYSRLLRQGLFTPSGSDLSAMRTAYGWMILGATMPANDVHTHLTIEDVNSTLRRFWELEEVPHNHPVNPEERKAEEIFTRTVSRTSSGRIITSLPFRDEPPLLTNSPHQADRRLIAMERRFALDDSFRRLYVDFMQDYLDQGHMRRIPENALPLEAYFIPHHGIFRNDDAHSKIRVVFDASSKPAAGPSLNDALLVGPKLQPDIFNLLLCFRFQAICFTCDIRQMYRQILITPEHRRYQVIRWRFHPHEPISNYELQTVTYGTASAPFLAIRTLHHLADIYATEFPLGAAALRSSTYVDDILCGAPDVSIAIRIRNELSLLLGKAGFELRKWTANRTSVLAGIPPSHLATTPTDFESGESITKILGLRWHAAADCFQFNVLARSTACTKRTILGELARIYDPLGFLSPLTLFAKHLIQQLWMMGIGWDEQPPPDVSRTWNRFTSELPLLSQLQIPRNMNVTSSTALQLHGFCDSSTVGYAAVVYVRTSSDEQHSVHLVAARSRVTPLKRISIPRLELQAALLLSELMTCILPQFQQVAPSIQYYAWTDSSVALSWIQSPSYRWKTFVANRVTQIQERIAPNLWRHVPTNANPADPASRGLLPADMIESQLWWQGPRFLSLKEENWPAQPTRSTIPIACTTECSQTALVVNRTPTFVDELVNRFSKLARLQSVTAYIFRFQYNTTHAERRTGALSLQELEDALIAIVRAVQHQSFDHEIRSLARRQPCTRPLQRLRPFLDERQLMRVGGRLRHAELDDNNKHPLILPAKHPFTALIIQNIHVKYLHAGITTTIYLLLQRYWVLSARRAVRKVIFECLKCYRQKPHTFAPMMADLPEARVTAAKPFSTVGIDFGGPYSITLTRHRGVKTQKAYICIFICFSTKAVHLELVSDLTTAAFLAALRRFIARRGTCHTIHSDCGTNFVGAHREMRRMLNSAAAEEQINWVFNPPSAPHFGGLWESNIKCVKHHLKRVIGEQILTYEEFSTFLCQVEAILNSRPLTIISSDASDSLPLSPGHFLTMAPLTAIPAPGELLTTNVQLLSRWKLVERLHQDFWRRWSNEYLHSLQQRSKWLHANDPPAVGTPVLIKNEITPPTKWKLGRIDAVHPGPDGQVRVVTVRTSSGTLVRPLVKLCPLPFQQ